MKHLTSPLGRKVILWVASVALVSIGLNAIAEARRWDFWRAEAAQEVDAQYQAAREYVKDAHALAERAAMARAMAARTPAENRVVPQAPTLGITRDSRLAPGAKATPTR